MRVGDPRHPSTHVTRARAQMRVVTAWCWVVARKGSPTRTARAMPMLMGLWREGLAARQRLVPRAWRTPVRRCCWATTIGAAAGVALRLHHKRFRCV